MYKSLVDLYAKRRNIHIENARKVIEHVLNTPMSMGDRMILSKFARRIIQENYLIEDAGNLMNPEKETIARYLTQFHGLDTEKVCEFICPVKDESKNFHNTIVRELSRELRQNNRRYI
jgi:DNA-directed RNA polymerase subunit F